MFHMYLTVLVFVCVRLRITLTFTRNILNKRIFFVFLSNYIDLLIFFFQGIFEKYLVNFSEFHFITYFSLMKFVLVKKYSDFFLGKF